MAIEIILSLNVGGHGPYVRDILAATVEDTEFFPLTQSHPAVNGVALKRGVFDTKAGAIAALMDAIPDVGKLLRISTPDRVRWMWQPLDRGNVGDQFSNVTVLASRTANGVFVAT